MPELPEVETIRIGLEKYLVGKKILSVKVLDRKVFEGDESWVTGATVKEIRRFGKGLLIDLSNGYSFAIHVKLTGQLIYRGEETKDVQLSPKVLGGVPSSFTRVIITLSSENEVSQTTSILYFNDIRRFAWMKIVATSEVPTLPFFKDLGPEPLKDLDLDKFAKIVSSGNSPIKVILMDQKKIAGIGNIYANDALNLARIDPSRKSRLLTSEEIKNLYNSIQFVLEKGLSTGGASELQYVNAAGVDGGYQNHFLVYARQGKVCHNCNGHIEKIRLAGRGTYFCPKCQV